MAGAARSTHRSTCTIEMQSRLAASGSGSVKNGAGRKSLPKPRGKKKNSWPQRRPPYAVIIFASSHPSWRPSGLAASPWCTRRCQSRRAQCRPPRERARLVEQKVARQEDGAELAVAEDVVRDRVRALDDEEDAQVDEEGQRRREGEPEERRGTVRLAPHALEVVHERRDAAEHDHAHGRLEVEQLPGVQLQAALLRLHPDLVEARRHEPEQGEDRALEVGAHLAGGGEEDADADRDERRDLDERHLRAVQ